MGPLPQNKYKSIGEVPYVSNEPYLKLLKGVDMGDNKGSIGIRGGTRSLDCSSNGTAGSLPIISGLQHT